ncbi:MAG: hypothetical protein ACM3XS_02215 [Bacteroidota bacterium]
MPVTEQVFPDLEAAGRRWRQLVGTLAGAVLREQRWFQGRTASLTEAGLLDHAFLPWPQPEELVALNIVRLTVDGVPQDYYLPLILLPERPGLSTMARFTVGGTPYVLAEASLSRRVNSALLTELAKSGVMPGERGRFTFHPASPGRVRAVQALAGDSSNTVLHLHRDEVVKIIRRLQPGLSREVRLGLALQDQAFIPAIHGHLVYEAPDGTPYTLAIWQEFLPNRGNLWNALVAGLSGTMRAALAPGRPADAGEMLTRWLWQIAPQLDALAVLTADLHAALARAAETAPFAEEDLERIIARTRRRLADISGRIAADPPDLWASALDLLNHLAGRLRDRADLGVKIETHGDLHLGQVLVTEEGYAVLDLEGEPLLAPEAQAAHTTVLRDLAGLVRSFSYAGQVAYLSLVTGQRLPPPQAETARFLAERFADRAAEHLIRHYGAAITGRLPGLAPADPVVFMELLDLCRLEKVVYEMAYELANRPEWIPIPLEGLRRLLSGRLSAEGRR